jgi:hypothetical protein
VEWLKVITLFRLIAFMVLVYLALGLLVERFSTKPDSKLRGFFRLICAPITGPISRRMPGGSTHQQVLRISFAVVGAFWIVFVILDRVIR